MITRILINLIANAIKFTQSGSVSVRASREGSGWFKFEVEDTGIGIKDSEFPNIFKDFHRVDNGHRLTSRRASA
jgi:signal transduction histidine kinase